MSDSGIQHKQTFGEQPGFGFDDDGERVPATKPDDSVARASLSKEDEIRVGVETLVRLLSHLLRAETPDAIGRAVLLLGFLSKHPDAPQTQAELAERIGLTPGRVSQVLPDLEAKYKSGDFAGLSEWKRSPAKLRSR